MVGSITGDLFEMPAGPFQFAAGAEYRSNSANFRPDSYLSSGDVVGFNASQPVEGEITSTEYFAELAVPLLKDITAIKALDLELGYRFSDYNLSESTDTYKAALKWNPIESLSLRASYNRAIRAPNINGAVPAATGELPAVHRPLQRDRLVPYGSERGAGRDTVRAHRAFRLQTSQGSRSRMRRRRRSSAAIRISIRKPPIRSPWAWCGTRMRERLGQQPAGGGRLLRLRDRGRDLVAELQLDHRPLLQPAGCESDVRPQQRVLPVVRTQSGQFRNHGRSDHDAEPVRARSHGRGPVG